MDEIQRLKNTIEGLLGAETKLRRKSLRQSEEISNLINKVGQLKHEIRRLEDGLMDVYEVTNDDIAQKVINHFIPQLVRKYEENKDKT